MKRLVLSVLAAAAIAAPAHATVVTLNYSGHITANGYYNQSNDNFFTAGQRAYYDGLHRADGYSDPGSAYNFTFQYDTAAVPVGGKYAATLVSGSVGSFGPSYFNDFTTYITFAGSSIKYVQFTVEKLVAPQQYIYAFFNFGDATDVTFGVLPSTVTPALYSNIGASFEIWSGSNQRGWMDNISRGLSVVPPGSGGPTAAVPEAATWAMMIMGFGGIGAMLRRRRPVLA